MSSNLYLEVSSPVYARTIARTLFSMFGPALPRAKTEEEMRWEDDGGPLSPETDGYTHEIVAR